MSATEPRLVAAEPNRAPPHASERACSGGAEPGVVESYPLTPTQQGMLVHSLRARSPGVEIEQIVVRLPEEVDVARMRAAWAWGALRFDALRCSFSWHDGAEPRQRIHERATLPFAELDHGRLDELEREPALARFLDEDRARGLDLARAPIARVTLITRSPLDHVLVWTFHHALLDGRSFTRVLREVMGYYDAARAGEPYAPPRPPSFRAHCEHLAARDVEADRGFWVDHLRGFAGPTPLPASAGALAPRHELGERHLEHEASVGVRTTQRLLELGARHDFTLANAVQAAWAITLARHARLDEACFGSTRAARHGTVPGALEMVGCLIHTTPLRVAVPPQRDVLALLRELRAFGLAVRSHELAPLVAIQRWAELPAGTPLFESLVVFERYLLDHELREQGGAWSDRRVSVHEQSEPPLVLAAYQDRDDLLLKLEHDAARFDGEGITRVLEHVVSLLRGIAERPEARVGDLPMISEDERDELLALAGGEGPLLATSATTLPEALAQRAGQVPHALALVHEDTRVTHAALELEAAALATRLAQRGVGRGDVVAVSVRRGAHLAAALLGVLRAGAVYLPVDPSWPRDRIALVLEDARARLALVDASTRGALAGAPLLDLDAARALPAEPAPLAAIDPGAPATLIYTSGSTGRPKGVLVPHCALLAHARAIVPAFDLTLGDRCLQFTSPSFDVALEEMLPTWLAGACVVTRSEEAARSVDTLLREIERDEVTVLNLPSAFFTEVALHLRDHARTLPSCVRLVVVGGERPSAAAYAMWRERHPNVRFLNAYGPTEVTITSTICDPERSRVPADARTELPVGRPLGTCRAYLLDAGGRLAPRGAVGELALAGPQVALGYPRRPELTSAAFAPDPFAADGGMMMRTGDLARWNASGELELLGRADDQIKLRGFRIEPGEIEAVLRGDPRVRQAVVGVRSDAAETPRLVAWVVLAEPVGPEVLRARCEAALPAPMVPSAFVPLDALPLSTSGKIDRRALPAPVPELDRAASHLPSRAIHDDPRGELETWIASVFADLLGRERVGAEESFFELGGHSLLAVRLHSRLSMRRPIDLGAIFRAPSVRGIARALSSGDAPSDAALVPLNQGDPSRAPLHLFCGVQLYASLGRALEEDRPVLGGFLPVEVSALSADDVARLDVRSMATAYLARLRAERPRGPYVLGGVSFGGVVAFEIAQQLRATGEEVALLVLLDTILPRGLHRATLAARARRHLGNLLAPSTLAPHLRESVARRLARRGTVAANGALATPDLEAARGEMFRVAAERYDEEIRPYEGAVTIFTARHRMLPWGDLVDGDLGWGALVPPDTTYHPIDGDHLTLLKEPGVSEIARILRERLREV